MSIHGYSLPIFTVDAFADVPFSGNQAAVIPVPVHTKLSDEVLQKIAVEMNYAETAYIQQLSEDADFVSGSRFGLRWFTPAYEVKLCGHATLASAAVMFQELGNKNEVIEFQTKLSGSLFVRKSEGGVTIDLPLNATQKQEEGEFKEFIEAMCCGLEVQDLAWNDTQPMLLIRLADSLTREQFEGFQPDLRKAEKIRTEPTEVVFTMKADPSRGFVDIEGKPFDFVSRFFETCYGLDEDPVTGAAHTVLVDYWSKQYNKNEFYARQCSRRGGNVIVKLEGDRVKLTGKGIVIVRGTITF